MLHPGEICLVDAQGSRSLDPDLHLDSGAAQRVVFPLDLNQLANGAAAQPGDVFLFQLWHRDVVGGTNTSNLSATVSITFQ